MKRSKATGETKVFSMRLDAKTYNRLHEYAQETKDRPAVQLTSVVALAVRLFLDSKEAK